MQLKWKYCFYRYSFYAVRMEVSLLYKINMFLSSPDGSIDFMIGKNGLDFTLSDLHIKWKIKTLA